MFKILILNTIFTCGSICTQSLNAVRPNIDSIFISWNKATFQSLERQKTAATDAKRKASYTNRIWGFAAYLGIDSSEKINTASLRYLFLKDLLLDKKNKVMFVIEANSMGAKLVVRNFVVYKNSLGDFVIQLYTYSEKEWHKRGRVEFKTFPLNSYLNRYVLKDGGGFNFEDIVISYFDKNTHGPITSEYYLEGTLSTESGVKQILDNYDRGRFE